MASRFRLALLATLVCAGAACAEANIFPSRNTLAAALKKAECNRSVDQALKEPTVHKLDGGHTLVFLSCWLGPYQASDLVILTGPSTKNEPRVLVFHEWVDGKFEPTLAVMMAEYDPKTKAVTSYNKSRGPSDCGSAGEWTWTGNEFRMTGFWYKNDCDGELFERVDRYRIFPRKK